MKPNILSGLTWFKLFVNVAHQNMITVDTGGKIVTSIMTLEFTRIDYVRLY